ncbi:hypothetical protein LQE92_06860 [Lacrimispora sp. NSJ-141]|uniref:Cyclophilin-like domain-containing protein n=1 Tax=Lientehia hominis TaxID=2897778 RepID=A0AAP2RII6_9FIRM|nr:cyclophilin-like fold protein [Lientehia hominis]MCD2492351.1 hypothetical protein [Lientehia hominis]
MTKNRLKRLVLLFALTTLLAVMMAGCGRSNERKDESVDDRTGLISDFGNVGGSQNTPAQDGAAQTELYVSFGGSGPTFIMHLYDNDTAAAIARHVGTADWQLPIYNYEGYDNWEVMQYYDIPSRYEIPENPESVTAEPAGAVYYSEPNRIVLFYGDAEVSGEYTPVGYFDDSEEFRSAVADNPVLEEWGNKIVLISAGE